MSLVIQSEHFDALNFPEQGADYLVKFDCHEYAIRRGSGAEEVMYPDPLGCAVLSVQLLAGVRLAGVPWERDGELRCEPVLGI